MSAEYAARMEVLQHRREELTAQRQAVEKRLALREATAAEFSAVALQSYKQKWKTQRSAAVAAKKRNDEFVRSLHEAQRQVHETWRELQGGQSSSSALLAQEKAQHNRRVEQIFPAWQEQLQRQRVQKLRELEDKKRKVERRRYLAKKSFEKEQTLDDLIRKTRHEVEMAENLEQNELYERELLRTQSTNQAKEVDQSIREVAQEARGYLQQQAEKHFERMPDLDDGVAGKLSETFSPRNALRALREGSRSFAFEENQDYKDEEKPARQIRIEIPTRMNTPTRSYHPDVNQRHPNQAYRSEETFADDWFNENPRGFDESPVLFNPTVTERHQTAARNVRNEYTNFEQSAAIAQDHQNQPGNMTSIPRATFSQLPAQPEMNQPHIGPQSVLVGNEHREEITRGPEDNHREKLSTFVTGRLYPIPEVNEQVLLHGSSPEMPTTVRVHSRGTEDERKSSVAGTSSTIFSTTPAAASSSSPPGLLLPAKIEENRVASTPDVRTVFTAPVDNSANAGRADKEYHVIVVSPKVEIEDGTVEEPPATSGPQSREISVPSLSLDEGKTELPAGISVEQPQKEVRWDTKSDEASSNDEISTVAERDANLLHMEKMDIPSQPDDAVDNFGTLSDFGSEGSLDSMRIDSEPVDIKHSGVFEGFSTASVVTDTSHGQAFDENPSHASSRKVDSSHDATSEAAEAFVREPERRRSENFLPEVLETSLEAVPYTVDLLEPLSPPVLKRIKALVAEDDMLLSSMQSDEFDVSASDVQPVAETPSIPSANDTIVKSEASAVLDSADSIITSPPSPAVEEETNTPSITEKLLPVDRVKALGALISRVEEGATEGDTLGGSVDTGSSSDSKRELLKMAVGRQKAQIAFFGSDICFELILDISRDLGPVLFPPKAFEGIMNDQKLRKLHQSNKEKQLDLWKALSGLLKQLVQLKAMPSSTLVDLFVAAFLAHDPDNQRSQRKLREFLVTVCGGSPRKGTSTASPPPSPPKQERRTPSPEPARLAEPESRIGTPALLQTAFLQQRQSPPKPRAFGIASSSYKDRSSGSSDVLASMSMSSGPMKLSQKLMRGGKMNDYSEFEEEEEVDLQNLIGSKPTFGSGSSGLGRSTHQAAKTSRTGKAAKQAAVEEEDDEFDF